MDESAVAEEEQRIFQSHVREDFKALKIMVINQHLKYITNDIEVT